MKIYKYDLHFTGTPLELTELAEGLLKLGYKPVEDRENAIQTARHTVLCTYGGSRLFAFYQKPKQSLNKKYFTNTVNLALNAAKKVMK